MLYLAWGVYYVNVSERIRMFSRSQQMEAGEDGEDDGELIDSRDPAWPRRLLR